MSGYVINELRAAELADAANVWFRSWHAAFPDLSHPMPYEGWLPRLRDEIAVNCACRVATSKGVVVGFVAVDLAKACLEQIFVAPDCQARGIGKLLMDEAKQLSPSRLTLTTPQRNTRAAEFYRREGFTTGGTGINPVNGLPNIEYVWLPASPPKHTGTLSPALRDP